MSEDTRPLRYVGTTATAGQNLGGFVLPPTGSELLTIGQSGRKGNTTHSKQKGVKYIIKVL